MKRLLVAAAANYGALHGCQTQLAFAAGTSTGTTALAGSVIVGPFETATVVSPSAPPVT